MVASKFLLVTALAAAVSAYPDFLTNPELRWVGDWKRVAAERRVARAAQPVAEPDCPLAELEKRDNAAAAAAASSTTLTRGSQPNPTDACFNVYNIAPPADNPSGKGPDGQLNHGYQRPGTNDVRSPCPALNTLSNHGYLPRDGRDINGSALVTAFQDGLGIDESVITVPKQNALSVCTFQAGGSENDSPSEQCNSFDLNILNEPHQFEHDHSFSRNDFNTLGSNGPLNNHVFNGTIFNQSLAVLKNSCYMTIQQANQVRLQRQSEQFVADKPGWLTLAVGVQETEMGFIFALVSENNQPGGSHQASGATVRVSWWQYWFMYESFPTPLGWQRPSPAVKNSFVTSISSLVIAASITSTPTPFYSEFISGNIPSTVTKSNGVTFQPALPNVYSSAINFKREAVAEATPTPA